MFRQLPSILGSSTSTSSSTTTAAAAMSSLSSSSAASSTSPAPWRAPFLNDIGKMPQPTFTLSTLHHPEPFASASASSRHGPAAAPRARTCIFRGLWAELPPNDRNAAERNPPVFASDLLTFTTDRRMHKHPDLLSASATASSSSSSSGGGGAVEACFWAAEAQAQWRVRGRSWVLGAADADGPGEGAARAREAVQRRVRYRGGGEGESRQQGDWSWAREVRAHFGNLSPAMRGTFRNPAPGTPRAVPGGEGEALGQKVESEDGDGDGDGLALGNFRVCVVVPEEVELVDLSDPADPRRWLYVFVGGDGGSGAARQPGGEVIGEWERVELWP